MASELKTRPNDGDVGAFIDSLDDPGQQADSRALVEMLGRVTGEPAVMWGTSIVGFGSYTYENSKGEENEWMAIGFAPRKRQMTIYCMDGFSRHGQLLDRLGKHSTAKSCLYVKRLEDIDPDVLEALLTDSYANTTRGLISYE